MKYLINDTVLRNEKVDIAIADGVIAEIGPNLKDKYASNGYEVISGKETIALQGLVDLHTHLREPGTGFRNCCKWIDGCRQRWIHRSICHGKYISGC